MTKVKRSTLHDLQAKWENYIALTATVATSRRYARALNVFFDKFTDKQDPEDFTRVDIEDFKVYRRREGVGARTINYEVQIVKSFWTWLQQMELASYNPCSTAKRLKEIEPLKQSLSEEQQNVIYDTVTKMGSVQDRLLVSLSLSTGLRAETLVQLENSDVDRDSSLLRIPATKMKAGRNHEVPIRQETLDLIDQLPAGRFFDGYSRDAKSLSYRFNRILSRSGVSLRGLRTGRRTFATTLLRTGTDIGIVKTLMGHRSVLTTSRYITEADSEQVRAAVNKLPSPGQNPSGD